WTLRRIDAAEPATGLLLETKAAAEVLALCVALGMQAAPRLHAVAGGVLLHLSSPPAQALPGAIRLRQLTENLFLPVDAELWPALLPDEAAGLVRRQGLVFLPGGRVLSFAPAQSLSLRSLLRPRRLVRGGGWRPLPEPAPLADRLQEIRLDLP